MKNLLLTIILSIVGMLNISAADTQTCVVVEFKDGQTLALALEEKPKAKFDNGQLLLSSEKFEGSYATADVKRFYFKDIETAIKEIENTTKMAGQIYDLGGRKVADFDGKIDVNTLPTGVYVVKTENGKSFKITTK